MRLELSTTDASARFYAKYEDGTVYDREAMELRLDRVGQLGYDLYNLTAPTSWVKRNKVINTAQCEEIVLEWTLPTNATFRMIWLLCDKDEVLTSYAAPRYNQVRYSSVQQQNITVNFDDSFNKTIFGDAVKLSWEYVYYDYITYVYRESTVTDAV
jgi:hypothetical protein